MLSQGNRVEINQRLSLNCVVEGNPRPVIFWRMRRLNGQVNSFIIRLILRLKIIINYKFKTLLFLNLEILFYIMIFEKSFIFKTLKNSNYNKSENNHKLFFYYANFLYHYIKSNLKN